MPTLMLQAVAIAASISAASAASSADFASAAAAITAADAAAIRVTAASIRERAVCWREFSRYSGSDRLQDKPMGGTLVQPIALRRVPIWNGMRLHFDRARLLQFPLDTRLRASSLPPALNCSVYLSARIGTDLERFRDALIREMVADSEYLRPISEKINALMPPTVRRISSGVNTAFMAALIDALEWPDTHLVERFVFGFPIVGDIPDSGIFRVITPTLTETQVEAAYREYIAGAPAWNARIHRRLRAQRWADEAGQAANLAVRAKTLKEHSKSLLVGPFNSVDHAYMSINSAQPPNSTPTPPVRVMERFGVVQGDDIRCIDNGRSCGANAASRLRETITTPTFFYPALIARAFELAGATCAATGEPHFLVLLDLTAAYRTIPVSQPWFTVVAYFDPVVGKPQYYWLPGHNFG